MIYLSRFHLNSSNNHQVAKRTFHSLAQYFAALRTEPYLENYQLTVGNSSSPYDGDTPPQSSDPIIVATFDTLEQMCFDLARHSLQQPKCSYIAETLMAAENELDAMDVKVEDEFCHLTPSDVVALIVADIQFLNCSTIEAHYNLATGDANYYIYMNGSKVRHRIHIECKR